MAPCGLWPQLPKAQEPSWVPGLPDCVAGDGVDGISNVFVFSAETMCCVWVCVCVFVCVCVCVCCSLLLPCMSDPFFSVVSAICFGSGFMEENNRNRLHTGGVVVVVVVQFITLVVWSFC